MKRTTALMLPMMLAILALLLFSLWLGLARLGVPEFRHTQMMLHGPLIVSGVLGTLISLERAVAVVGVLQARERYLAYAAPVLSALGGIALVLHPDLLLGQVLLVLGSAALVMIFFVIVIRHPSADSWIMTLGAIALLEANGLWALGRPNYEVVHWWIAFLVLTIIGERLELARIVRITARQRAYLLGIIAVYILALLWTQIDLAFGTRLVGLSSVLLAAWLLRYDIARITIRRQGLPRFTAICLLSGYVWLALGGAIALWQGALYIGFMYEAMLHAILIGFVFAMIFGHAPIIIPALTQRQVHYHPILYLPLLLLHGSLIMRVIGDMAVWLDGRTWGGILNTVAILLFFALMLPLVLIGSRSQHRQRQQQTKIPT